MIVVRFSLSNSLAVDPSFPSVTLFFAFYVHVPITVCFPFYVTSQSAIRVN